MLEFLNNLSNFEIATLILSSIAVIYLIVDIIIDIINNKETKKNKNKNKKELSFSKNKEENEKTKENDSIDIDDIEI